MKKSSQRISLRTLTVRLLVDANLPKVTGGLSDPGEPSDPGKPTRDPGVPASHTCVSCVHC